MVDNDAVAIAGLGMVMTLAISFVAVAAYQRMPKSQRAAKLDQMQPEEDAAEEQPAAAAGSSKREEGAAHNQHSVPFQEGPWSAPGGLCATHK